MENDTIPNIVNLDRKIRASLKSPTDEHKHMVDFKQITTLFPMNISCIPTGACILKHGI